MRDLGFALNDEDFSDRILQLEVVPEAVSMDYSSDFTGSGLNQKRPLQGKGNIAYDNNSECSSDGKLKSVHICSTVLASCSPFFYKLFKNGMRNSKDTVVNLEINKSEETAFMDLLNYMYKNSLVATSANDLVNVLIVADKFEVTCCMRYCIDMLLKLSMTQESALLYLEIPSSVLVSEIVKPLIDVAKKYLADRYKDFTKYQEEAMKLPLSGVEVVLGSEGLQVISEDVVYDFILEWAREHYPDLGERREILSVHLLKLICFTNMSSSKMKEALACVDFEHEQVSKLVTEALFSKLESPFGGQVHTSKGIVTTNQAFLGRIYTPHYSFYFDLKKDELKSLQPSARLHSQTFCVGGKEFQLFAERVQVDRFGLYVKRVAGSTTCTISIEAAVMNKSSKEFENKGCGKNCKFEDSLSIGWGDFLDISWTELMRDECEYFIDGVLHIRTEISLVKNPECYDIYLSSS